jgi:hypothetical protein
MNLDALFEDLESQFLEPNHCFEMQTLLAKRNRLTFRIDDEELVLIAPILGSDFVAGFHERRAAWICAGLPKASVLKFAIDRDSRLPKLRRRAVKLEDFVGEMNPPFAAQFKPTGQSCFDAVLIAIENSIAYFKLPSPQGGQSEMTAIAISALDWLGIVEAKDSADVNQWRSR